MPELISLADAKAAGRIHYYTGERCAAGHDSERYVQSRACVQCIKAHVGASRERYAAAQAADTLRPHVIRFARETVAYPVRVPETQVAAVGAIVAGMLAAHFPELVGTDRVGMEPPVTTRGHAAGSCIAVYLIHRDDREAVEALAKNAMKQFAITRSTQS